MWGDAWRRLRRNRGAVVGAAIVVLLVTLAAAAPFLAPRDPNAQDLSARLLPPSPQHLLGTDEFGRDMLSRLVYGARPALAAGMLAAAIAMGWTSRHLPVPWLGSTNTGRWESLFTAATALKSRVFLV